MLIFRTFPQLDYSLARIVYICATNAKKTLNEPIVTLATPKSNQCNGTIRVLVLYNQTLLTETLLFISNNLINDPFTY